MRVALHVRLAMGQDPSVREAVRVLVPALARAAHFGGGLRGDPARVDRTCRPAPYGLMTCEVWGRRAAGAGFGGGRWPGGWACWWRYRYLSPRRKTVAAASSPIS